MSRKEFNQIKTIYVISFVLITITMIVSSIAIFTPIEIPVIILIAAVIICALWAFILIIYMAS